MERLGEILAFFVVPSKEIFKLRYKMTKYEIKADLKSRGKLDVNDGRDPSWQKAFQLYYQETRNKLSMSCGACYTRLRNWMNS